MNDTEPTELDDLNSIIEILHNSWLEDDYEYDDPNGLDAIRQIRDLINKSYISRKAVEEAIGEDEKILVKPEPKPRKEE